MTEPSFPKSWKKESQPHKFCPGCGQSLALKILGYAIDELGIQDKTVYACDIGCSLLTWDMFDIDTIQTHHGRTTSVMVGYKMMKPKRLALGYMGDGAAYAIGLQSILHAAFRNDPVTLIIINNENYAMTGGQMSPETLVGTVTSTTPEGKPADFGPGLRGPELIRNIADSSAFIARASISNPIQMKSLIKKAIDNQLDNNAFSLVEVLSICPINWKTDAQASFGRLKEMENYYRIGEINTAKEDK